MTDGRETIFFGEAHMVPLLLYIGDNPGCRKSDIYRDVVRNDRVPDKLGLLAELGLVSAEEYGNNRARYTLTVRGEALAGLLGQALLVLRNGDRGA